MAIRAAQYVRMSTDQQIYSIANQSESIAVYAALNGFDVVRTYADEGRSGLSLKGRSALQQLLADVLGGEQGFNAVLVYDISRWGRFQDADESAHYEFLCRNAGVPIHYCAEPFNNDGSLSAAIMKSLKRVMAGEYSRELSAKVYAGCARLAKQGFKMGGGHRLGYRRMMVDENGLHKGLLQPGQQKHFRTDHVIVMLGPPDEIALVRRMFRLCARKGLSTAQIAALLNSEGERRSSGDRWTATAVGQILRCEQYVGIGTYGRYSKKLGAKQVRNDRSLWIQHEGFIPPLIDHATFRAAKKGMAERQWRRTDDQLLGKLRDLYKREGCLSVRLVLAEPGMPTPPTYRLRFGSFTQACRMVGYERPSIPYASVHPTLLHDAVALLGAIEEHVLASGGRAEIATRDQVVIVDRTITLGATLCRSNPARSSGKWRIYLEADYGIDFLLVGLLDGMSDALSGYALLPSSRFGITRTAYISDSRRSERNYRFSSLNDLLPLIRAIDNGGDAATFLNRS